MERLTKFLDGIFSHLSRVAMLLLFIVMMIEVIFRYIPGLHMAQPWVPGILSLIDVWLIYLGSVVAMRANSHLRITFLVDRMSARQREWNNVVVNSITLSLLILVSFYSIPIVRTGMDLTFFGGFALSKGYNFIAVPICACAMALMVIRRILQSIQKIRLRASHG
ncbi:MAG: TRAP transporter small permease subunit [Deltaproteobacteria bacterium]|nr:TRAP transporter small permease subunit [Deltaproteobacteria bacterium]